MLLPARHMFHNLDHVKILHMQVRCYRCRLYLQISCQKELQMQTHFAKPRVSQSKSGARAAKQARHVPDMHVHAKLPRTV